ncbi:hypothetical protein T06_6115 [Trichinella sp. T6]|nr:hypothetical protein T06_6115 [Trichinella sp. T6]
MRCSQILIKHLHYLHKDGKTRNIKFKISKNVNLAKRKLFKQKFNFTLVSVCFPLNNFDQRCAVADYPTATFQQQNCGKKFV